MQDAYDASSYLHSLGGEHWAHARERFFPFGIRAMSEQQADGLMEHAHAKGWSAPARPRGKYPSERWPVRDEPGEPLPFSHLYDAMEHVQNHGEGIDADWAHRFAPDLLDRGGSMVDDFPGTLGRMSEEAARALVRHAQSLGYERPSMPSATVHDISQERRRRRGRNGTD